MKLMMRPSVRRGFWLALGCWLLLPARLLGQPATNQVTVTAQVEGTNRISALSAVVRDVEEKLFFTFGLDRIEALHRGIFGVPLYQYLASLVYILLAFYISKLLDLLIGTQLKRWAARTKTTLDDLVIGLIQGPIKIISFVILLHIGLKLFPWPDWIGRWISKGLGVVVACSLTYMLLRSVDVLVEYWSNRARGRQDRSFNHQLFTVISKSLKAFILIVAILVTSQNLGLNITAMLASLSIGGLALGLAAQDTVANLFGAVAVFVDKPFRVGDRIRLDNIEGVVESIGLRSTRVRNGDGFLVTIPNKTMGNATITNISLRPTIKTELNIGITYDTPAEKVNTALAIIKEIYSTHPITHDVVVGFNRFADSALNLNVVHWAKISESLSYMQGIQELNLALKKRFDAEKIEFAFPTQTLYVKHEGVPVDGRLPSPEKAGDNGTAQSDRSPR